MSQEKNVNRPKADAIAVACAPIAVNNVDNPKSRKHCQGLPHFAAARM
jgi:hypothetical protein